MGAELDSLQRCCNRSSSASVSIYLGSNDVSLVSSLGWVCNHKCAGVLWYVLAADFAAHVFHHPIYLRLGRAWLFSIGGSRIMQHR